VGFNVCQALQICMPCFAFLCFLFFCIPSFHMETWGKGCDTITLCVLLHRQVNAAHICYLVADATLESYSQSARLCLIGADHCKNPRTYVAVDAIQASLLTTVASL
jgi:hypothetical protein